MNNIHYLSRHERFAPVRDEKGRWPLPDGWVYSGDIKFPLWVHYLCGIGVGFVLGLVFIVRSMT